MTDDSDFKHLVRERMPALARPTRRPTQRSDPDVELGDVLGAVAVGLTPQTFRAYRRRYGDLTARRALELYTVDINP